MDTNIESEDPRLFIVKRTPYSLVARYYPEIISNSLSSKRVEYTIRVNKFSIVISQLRFNWAGSGYSIDEYFVSKEVHDEVKDRIVNIKTADDLFSFFDYLEEKAYEVVRK